MAIGLTRTGVFRNNYYINRDCKCGNRLIEPAKCWKASLNRRIERSLLNTEDHSRLAVLKSSCRKSDRTGRRLLTIL